LPYASKPCSADYHRDPGPRKSGAGKMRPLRGERNKERHGKGRTASSNIVVCCRALRFGPARYSSTQKDDGGAPKSGSQKLKVHRGGARYSQAAGALLRTIPHRWRDAQSSKTNSRSKG